jgi:hypothetical protein
MCPHTVIYVSSYCHSMCPHTATYVSSYCHICVLILPYMCPHTAAYVSSYCHIYCHICVLILLHMCPHTAICVLILSYMFPHTVIYVSSYWHICVLTLTYMCPHTAIYVFLYCYIRVFILPYMCPHTALCTNDSLYLELRMCTKKRNSWTTVSYLLTPTIQIRTIRLLQYKPDRVSQFFFLLVSKSIQIKSKQQMLKICHYKRQEDPLHQKSIESRHSLSPWLTRGQKKIVPHNHLHWSHHLYT